MEDNLELSLRKTQNWLEKEIENCEDKALLKKYEEDLSYIKDYFERFEIEIGSFAGLDKMMEEIVEKYKDRVEK